MPGPPRVHLLIEDLFFRSKVEATAAALDVSVAVVRDPADLAGPSSDAGAIVLVDLDHRGDPIAAIRALKRAPAPPTVVAFGSHVQAERLKAAREAGADRVLAKSAFTRRLPELLTRPAEPPS